MGEALRTRLQRARFDDPAEEAMLNILVTARAILDRLEEICGEHGISHSQFNILRILRGRHPDGLPLGEISGRMIVRAPDVSRLVDRLAAAGLVTRRASKEDRRVSVVTASRKGLETTAAISATLVKLHREFRRRVGVDACRTLSEICEQYYGE